MTRGRRVGALRADAGGARRAEPAFKSFVVFGFATAVVCGGFLGLFSCGGVAWHKTAIHSVLVAVAIAIVVGWRKAPPGLVVRIPLATALAGTFLLARALANPFYLGFESVPEYVDAVLVALRHGPC